MANRDREDRERPSLLARDHDERVREKDDRERREKDKERDDRHARDRREEDRHLDKKDYDKDRYRDDRERHRAEDKPRPRDKDRHDRYDRRSSADRKKSRKSPTPYSQKSHPNPKDSPDRSAKKKDKEHDDKSDDKKKEKKLKEKKKKKDDEKEKKKKKKKEKKSVSKDLPKDESVKVAADTCEAAHEPKPVGSPKRPEAKPNLPEDENSALIAQIASDAMLPEVTQSGFDEKSLAMNPEPPEFPEASPETAERQFATNPPNPNFKPIPELKSELKPIESLYSGLEDAEISTSKYSGVLVGDEVGADLEGDKEKSPTATSTAKKDEFLAPIPELSKWEREEAPEKVAEEDSLDTSDRLDPDEPKAAKMVTSEVLKRAENAIFQKAINAIRPIEIKKISESRKVLYQNPEPKVLEVDSSARKSVNVTINVGRNERNVEITEGSVKKGKLDRTKFKPVPETFSPTRLSAKERLGEKIEDVSKERRQSPMKSFLERRETKGEGRNRSPRREKRAATPLRGVAAPEVGVAERKVFLEERKRDAKERNKERGDFRGERHEFRGSRGNQSDSKERRAPGLGAGQLKRVGVAKAGGRDDRKPKEEKKRKKEHRSRSKSKERKKRKEKKHKKDKEKGNDKKQKHKEVGVAKEKVAEVGEESQAAEASLVEGVAGKKQRKNPRLVSDRKRSILDEASFEPDYSASDSESEAEEGGKLGALPAKKLKLEEGGVAKEEVEAKAAKKRQKSSSSEDTSSSDDSSTSDSESSDSGSHRKRRKKHRKHKKRKSARKETSSDTYTDSDTSETSSDEEKHKRKKKSRGRGGKGKKKKKSKHK